MTTETFLRREIHRLAHVKVQLGRMQACMNTWTLQLAIVPPPKTPRPTLTQTPPLSLPIYARSRTCGCASNTSTDFSRLC